MLKSCSQAALLMQHLPDKHPDWVDVLLDARFSAWSLFPLFSRLYFVPCPGDSALFELCIHHFLCFIQFSLCSLGTSVNKAWSCAAWLPDKKWWVRLWIHIKSPHCTSHITQQALTRQVHSLGKDVSTTSRPTNKCQLGINTTEDEYKVFMNQAVSQSQTIALTEAEDNLSDYWHCREILVRFPSTIIYNNSLITNFSCWVPQYKIHLLSTGKALLLLNVKTCKIITDTQTHRHTFAHYAAQKWTHLPDV